MRAPAMSHSLPEFASEWIRQWKEAAPRLQAIRDEELRRQSDSTAQTAPVTNSIPLIFDRYPERHGMVVMQRWLMRRHLLETMRRSESASRVTRPADG